MAEPSRADLIRTNDNLTAALEASEEAREALLQDLADVTRHADELVVQLKTARIGAALVPGLQERIAELQRQVTRQWTSATS